jgi:hypothetical protein
MALDVVFRQEIRNILMAADHADKRALEAADRLNDEYVRGYQAGHHDALVTVALAFGLLPTEGQPKSDACLPIGFLSMGQT